VKGNHKHHSFGYIYEKKKSRNTARARKTIPTKAVFRLFSHIQIWGNKLARSLKESPNRAANHENESKQTSIDCMQIPALADEVS